MTYENETRRSLGRGRKRVQKILQRFSSPTAKTGIRVGLGNYGECIVKIIKAIPLKKR